jgi:hypothetical protein
MKSFLLVAVVLTCSFCFGQQSKIDFDLLDSLITTTPEIDLCKKDGKEDVRFMTKTPEKYSNFKQEFINQAVDAFSFAGSSHFFCDISVQINCEGKAGNYHFSIEPRNFKDQDFENFKQLIVLVNKLANFAFKPAMYLGENVNSKVSFRLTVKDGKPVLQ